MRGQRAVDVQACARRQTVMIQNAPGEVRGAVGVRAGRLERLGPRRREEQRRRGRRGADAAECPSEIAAKIEQPEMEPRGRFDEHRFAFWNVRHA